MARPVRAPLLACLLLAASPAALGAEDPAPAPAPVAVAVPAPGPSEDVLVLRDGREIRGRIDAENDTDYAVKVGGALRVVAKSDVKEVRRAPAPAPGEAPAAGPPAPGTAPAPGAAPAPEKSRRRARRGDAPGAAPEGPMEGPAAPAPPPLSDDARAWTRFCIDRLLSSDPVVQRSAAEALRALGPPVLPLLREAHASADEKGRQALERVARALEDGKGAPGPGGAKGAPRAPAPAPAPPPVAPGPARGKAILDRVRAELALDEEKSRAVGARLLSFGREAREVLMDARDGLISYEDARTRVTGLRAKLREDLAGTLDAAQQGKLDALLDELGPGRGGPPPRPKAPPPGEPPPK